MAIDHIKNVKISAVCCAVPKDVLTHKDFYEHINKSSVDRFVKDTGVKQKHCSLDRKTITSDLCFAAAEEIFKKKNIDKQSIDALIFITQGPDFDAPATSITLQYRLGLPESCMAYDVNLGCSGYVYGLHLAASKLQSGHLKKVLLLVGDAFPPISSQPCLDDLLKGDCGSATIIEYEKGAPGFKFELQSIGSGFKALAATRGERYACVGYPDSDPSIHMDGLAIVTFSITKVPKLFKSFFKAFDTNIDTYDSVLLHQPNKSMLNMIIKKIRVEKNKAPISLEKYSNTSSASIPNVMCYHYTDNHSAEAVPVIMCGFGIGLSLGIADAYVKPKDIMPIISTDITWNEGRSKVLEVNAKST